MRPRLLLVLLAIAVLGFAPAPFPKPARPGKDSSDLSKLQGTWDVVEYLYQGRRSLSEPAQVRISGDRFEFIVRGEVRSKWVVLLDPKTSPRTLDRRIGDDSRGLLRGIYRFDGDKLILCHECATAQRPRGFDQNGVYLITLRRAGR